MVFAAIAWCAVVGWPRPAHAQDVAVPGGAYAALGDYVQQIGSTEDQAGIAGPADHDAAFAALNDFARQFGGDQPAATKSGQIKIADADNAFDALKEFLQKHNGSAPAEPAGPAPMAPVRRATEPSEPVEAATLVGTNVCLGCHTSQGPSGPFGYTEMGRLAKLGKLQCETCHGPGSAHVHAAGCAACHGDGGISSRPGIPSLAGQDPQYLVTEMKAFITGQRRNALMKALLSGVGEAELNNIALYYARQVPARAQTPPVGNPSAGKAAIGLCAGCHGEQGVSVSPAFPNLAGQDAQYLADALREFRDGSRKKEVACAACHGDRGISARPGIPSLVGQDPQYLVAAMKAYVTGQRKNAVMKALLAGVDDAELNNIALYYAQQSPARAQTPPVGNPSAGKAASAACAACHGAEGVSANPAWPSLAGQDARYFAGTLEDYKNGSRSDATMKGIVASLDQQTIDNLAGYYASLRPAQPSSTKNTPAKPAPVLLRNGLVASLDQRTINDIASYFASQPPARPNTRKVRACQICSPSGRRSCARRRAQPGWHHFVPPERSRQDRGRKQRHLPRLPRARPEDLLGRQRARGAGPCSAPIATPS